MLLVFPCLSLALTDPGAVSCKDQIKKCGRISHLLSAIWLQIKNIVAGGEGGVTTAVLSTFIALNVQST